MKNLLAILPFLFIATGAFSQSNGYYVEKTNFSDAIEYNDYIVDMVTLIDKAWDMAIDAEDLKSSMSANKELKTISGKVIKSLNKLSGYNGESGFKNAAMNYAQHMNAISKKELPQFLKLLRGPGEFTIDKEKKAEALIPVLDDKREALFSAIEKAQEDFAANNNFTIEGH